MWDQLADAAKFLFALVGRDPEERPGTRLPDAEAGGSEARAVVTTNKLVLPVLHGDGEHDDRPALRSLFNGLAAKDLRTGEVIFAGTMKELPPGTYRTCPGI